MATLSSPLHEAPNIAALPTMRQIPRAKGSKSTGTIAFLGIAVIIPFVAFSGVLLGLVFRNLVEQQDSNFSLSEIIRGTSFPGGYYLVDYPATRLIFISSWSNSIAPRAVGFATALWLFPVTAKLVKRSLENETSDLPTKYQFSMLIGLSLANLSEFWKFIKYSFSGRSTPKKVSTVNTMFLVLLIGQLLALAIFAVDAILHFTTESVPFVRMSETSGRISSFGQGLISLCTGDASIVQAVGKEPCTYNIAATGEGFYDASEVSATLNNISTSHQILNSIYDVQGTQTDLLLLGPPLTSVPEDLSYQASTVGVATSCRPVSQQCDLRAPYGASTPFNCSSVFFGDLQIPLINTTTTLWGDNSTGNFLFGATFQDANLSQPYTNYSLNDYLNSGAAEPFTLNPFYMGIAARTAFGTNTTLLQEDPQITLPEHGGLAFILSCEVLTVDLTYTFFNGSVTSIDSAVPSNGTMAWYFNSIIGASGSTSHLATGIDIAVAAPSAAELARSWSRSYSQEALSILASVHSARSNLAEHLVVNTIVTRIARGPLLALVALNLLFALLGAGLAVWALVRDSPRVSAVKSALGVEGLVAGAFGRDGRSEEQQAVGIPNGNGKNERSATITSTVMASGSGWQGHGVVVREGPDPEAELRQCLLRERGRIGAENSGDGLWAIRTLV